MRLEDLDKAFKQEANDENLIYVECRNLPIKITGFPWLEENGNYHRLPDKFEDKYSIKLNNLRKCASGGAVRFRTNSHLLGVKWELEPDTIDCSPRMTANMSQGFDFYYGEPGTMTFAGCINAQTEDHVHYRNTKHLSDEKIMREITLNFPLYSAVKKVEIGLDPDAIIEMPSPMKYEKPIVFYGNSVTQGGCASRPGLNYTALLTRKLGVEQINLGFSGSGRGEDFVAEMIADIPMSAFVMDYDHNARTVEHLKATHEEFFNIIRRKNPTLPIILLSRSDADNRPKTFGFFREVIMETYHNAIKKGDKHVYFLDGEKFFGEEDRLECTVDNTHPNDIGFYRIYQSILPTLKKALEEAE